MIPLHDDNPTTLKPLVTVGLIVVCVLVFLWQVTLPPGRNELAIYAFGTIPAVIFGARELPPDIVAIPAQLSLLTAMFLHGGWMHLIGNMLYLWIFGNNVEDAMGHGRFIAFYGLCGIAAGLAQALQDPSSTIPMIGASGAIGGVLGGYLLLYPRARVLVLIPLGFFVTMLRIPALYVLGFWFVIQFIQSAASAGQAGGVAYWAHIGGFLAGVVLIVPFRNKAFPLFGKARAPGPSSGPGSGPGPGPGPGSGSGSDTGSGPGRAHSRIPRSGPDRGSGRRGPWER